VPLVDLLVVLADLLVVRLSVTLMVLATEQLMALAVLSVVLAFCCGFVSHPDGPGHQPADGPGRPTGGFGILLSGCQPP
jgi:hypothetical protein